jgi:predicted permease
VKALFADLIQDLRYAARLLRANPAFTAVVVVMLALGIGANTAVFSVMNAVVLRNLPLPDPQQLVYVRTTGMVRGGTNTGDFTQSFPVSVFQQLRQERQILSDLIAFVPLSLEKTAVRYGNEPEEAYADMVSGNFFSGLGVRPLCGRLFAPAEETAHAQVAVLGYGYWASRFGKTCAVVGQTLFVRGVPFTIVGVAARDFIGVERRKATNVWIPLQDRIDLNAWGMRGEGTLYSRTNWWCVMLIGRLAPGVGAKQAQARLNPVFQRAAYAQSGGPGPKEKPPNLYFEPAQGINGLREAYQQPLQILLSMVGLVLVIACGNVALMLAARNSAREREFGVRLAIGGSRGRLFRQLLAESLLLVAGGAALAWLFAIAATRALSAWSGLDVSLAPDRTVLLFTLGVSLAAAVVFGLAPLRGAARVPVSLALRTSSATAGRAPGKLRARKAVIALQISLCLTLLIGAALLVESLLNLQHVNLGMRTSGLLVFGISPQQRARSDADTISFYEALLGRLRALPEVESVTLMQNRLGSGWSNNTSAFVDGKNPRGDTPSALRWNAVGPDYFRTLRTPLVYGRDFTEADTRAAPKVAIINQTFAARYLPHANPIGHRVSLSSRRGADQYTIVGVAGDSKYTGVRERQVPMAYFPYKQMPGVSAMHVEMRLAGDPLNGLPGIQRAVREFAPDLPLLEPMTQQHQFDSSISEERLFARLSMFFGLLAVLLVATGIYGTIAYTVSRRTSELGIRMALGARRGQVLWMVLRESLLVCIAGIVVGVPLAAFSSRLLRAMLFGVVPGDPRAIVAALFGIVIVAFTASLLPARRAAAISPLAALRYE